MKKLLFILVYACFFGGCDLFLYGQETKFPLPADSSDATMKETLEWIKGKLDGKSAEWGDGAGRTNYTHYFSYDLTGKKINVTKISQGDGFTYTHFYGIPICDIIGSSKGSTHYVIFFSSKVISDVGQSQYKGKIVYSNKIRENEDKYVFAYPGLDEEMFNRLNNAFNHLINLCKKSEKF